MSISSIAGSGNTVSPPPLARVARDSDGDNDNDAMEGAAAKAREAAGPAPSLDPAKGNRLDILA